MREILRQQQQDLPDWALLGAAFPKGRLQPWAAADPAHAGKGMRAGTAKGELLAVQSA